MKKYTIIVVIALVYLGIVLISMSLFDRATYLIINDDMKLMYKNNKWSKIVTKDAKLGQFDLYNMENGDVVKKKLTIKKGEVYVDGKPYDIADTIAYKGDISYVSYDTVYDINEAEINKLLNKLKLPTDGLITASVIDIDLDNDGEKEKIYTLNNVTDIITELDLYFSIAFVVDGNDYMILDKVALTEDFLNPHSITLLFDYKKDGKYEIIVERSGISRDDSTYAMYGLKDGKYVELIKTN